MRFPQAHSNRMISTVGIAESRTGGGDHGHRSMGTHSCLVRIWRVTSGHRFFAAWFGTSVGRANGVMWGGSEKGLRIKVTDEQLEMIRNMNAEGTKIARIARATGLSRPTVYAHLATV